MYPFSSQRRYWTFSSENEIAELRRKHNTEFIAKHGSTLDVVKLTFFLSTIENMSIFFQEPSQKQYFLLPDEERLLLRNYELHMREFCRRFEPQMPKSVVGTAFHYFKRFYLNNSPMDYHPKEILYVCYYSNWEFFFYF